MIISGSNPILFLLMNSSQSSNVGFPPFSLKKFSTNLPYLYPKLNSFAPNLSFSTFSLVVSDSPGSLYARSCGDVFVSRSILNLVPSFIIFFNGLFLN